MYKLLPAQTEQNLVLREHNQGVYKKIAEGFSQRNRVYFSHATGLGKSYIALQTILELAQQNRKNKLTSWTETRPLHTLFVSPSDVIQDYFVDAVEETLAKNPELKRIFKQNIKLHTCLYQGLQKKISGKYDLIVFDEMHRLGAPNWKEKSKKLLANNPQAKVLGMSATLERMDGQSFEYIREFFGNEPPVSDIDVVRAMQEKLLPAPKYVIAQIKKITTGENWLDVDEKILNEQLNSKNLVAEEKKEISTLLKQIKFAKQNVADKEDFALAIKKQFDEFLKEGKDLRNSKFIVFCPSGNEDLAESKEELSRMENLMKISDEWFGEIDGVSGIKKFKLYSKQGKKRNAKILKEFKEDNSGGIKLMFAINMLNEGLHAGDIDGVIMLRNTNSRIIYLQQLGRVLSVGKKDKKPLIFDLVDNINSNMSVVQQIAKSVNSYGAVENLNSKNQDNNPTTPVDFELLISHNVQFMQALQDKINSFLHRNNFNFDNVYARLIEYNTEFGNCLVPRDHKTKDGYPLGGSTGTLRTKYNNNQLSQEEINKLESIGFVWDAKKTFDFNLYVEELIQYKNEFGNCLVPQNHKTKDGYPLGQSTGVIRKKYKNNELSPAQIKILDAIGFVWNAKTFDFNLYVEELIQYKTEFGNCLVPRDHKTKDGYPLGRSTGTIRQKYKNNQLSQEQIKILESMGFAWDTKKTYAFDLYVKELIQYKNEFGNCLVPTSYKTKDGLPLGQSTSTVRKKYKNNELSPEQIKILDSMGFVWNANSYTFDLFVDKLIQYKTEFGNCLVPKTYKTKDGFPLGQSTGIIRKKYKNNELSPEQRKILDSMGFVWNAISYTFDLFVEELIQYKNEFGNCLVPNTYQTKDGYLLGSSTAKLRQKHKKNKLSPEQIKILDSMGFVWDARKKSKDEKTLDETKNTESNKATHANIETAPPPNGVAKNKPETQSAKPTMGREDINNQMNAQQNREAQKTVGAGSIQPATQPEEKDFELGK